jgi:hypothetical protein
MTSAARSATGTACLPLSPGQEGIALQQRAAPGSVIFNIPAAVELAGDLDIEALRQALTDLTARHDVLRATFTEDGGAFTQTVHPPRPVPLRTHDIRHLPPRERSGAARAILKAEAARPFDLASEPGLRCMLVTTGDNRHILFWMMHHIVCDGWSKSILAADLSALYAARHAGLIPALPALPASYGDFVAYQRGLDPALTSAQLAYWDRQLNGAAAIPPLPADLLGRPGGGEHGGSVAVTIPASDTQRLAATAAASRATMFMALHACWAITLSRYSGQRDIIIASPYGGRPAPEFEPLIGFFVNVLPLRVRLHGDPSFREILGQVRGTALDGYENSQVAFHLIARRVAASAAGQIRALSQTSLAFANLPYEDIRLPGLAVSSYTLTRADVRFPLELQLWEDRDDHSIRGRLIYRTDLFTPQTAGQLAADFTAAAQQAAASPGARVPLPDIPPQAAAPPARPAAPQPVTLTATESALLAIWEELLHTDEISVDDSFPDVGGHSLLAALMVARIREELGADIPVPVIYQNPTARAIAAAIDAALAAGSQSPANTIGDGTA